MLCPDQYLTVGFTHLLPAVILQALTVGFTHLLPAVILQALTVGFTHLLPAVILQVLTVGFTHLLPAAVGLACIVFKHITGGNDKPSPKVCKLRFKQKTHRS